jgi:hypothetical protein
VYIASLLVLIFFNKLVGFIKPFNIKPKLSKSIFAFSNTNNFSFSSSRSFFDEVILVCFCLSPSGKLVALLKSFSKLLTLIVTLHIFVWLKLIVSASFIILYIQLETTLAIEGDHILFKILSI